MNGTNYVEITNATALNSEGSSVTFWVYIRSETSINIALKSVFNMIIA